MIIGLMRSQLVMKASGYILFESARPAPIQDPLSRSRALGKIANIALRFGFRELDPRWLDASPALSGAEAGVTYNIGGRIRFHFLPPSFLYLQELGKRERRTEQPLRLSGDTVHVTRK
jgi:hypothetical protein